MGGVPSYITRRPSLTANSLVLWTLQSFYPSSPMFPEPYVLQCFVNVSIRTMLHNSVF